MWIDRDLPTRALRADLYFSIHNFLSFSARLTIYGDSSSKMASPATIRNNDRKYVAHAQPKENALDIGESIGWIVVIVLSCT